MAAVRHLHVQLSRCGVSSNQPRQLKLKLASCACAITDTSLCLQPPSPYAPCLHRPHQGRLHGARVAVGEAPVGDVSSLAPHVAQGHTGELHNRVEVGVRVRGGDGEVSVSANSFK